MNVPTLQVQKRRPVRWKVRWIKVQDSARTRLKLTDSGSLLGHSRLRLVEAAGRPGQGDTSYAYLPYVDGAKGGGGELPPDLQRWAYNGARFTPYLTMYAYT